jgi:copper(I)-binding protein
MKYITLILLGSISLAYAQLPEIEDHWLRAAPPNANMMAAYGELTNTSDQDIYLVGAYSPAFHMTEIHKTIITDGIARMAHQTEILIKQGDSVSFKPGGLHIMLMRPLIKYDLGDLIKVNFIYQHADKNIIQEVWFPVEKR